ncbi:hypothetical protein UMNK88_3138 [Escherichia coli UMNK88]|nr:hypothetical protein UMNK88_3138 [Escherichia coli UMNK88]EGX16827.1 hypothetical protein ECSTECS1191_3386 [Escherichia coli STEC_S1191]OSK68067.1 hypothetical protein EADG_03361 [Escherichia coli E1114]
MRSAADLAILIFLHHEKYNHGGSEWIIRMKANVLGIKNS